MVKINNLKKKYGDFVLDCSMEVENGRITGIIGKNGSGKSTLFKSVLGLIKTDDGEITVFDKDIKKFTPADRENIGVVMADSGFSNYLNVNDIEKIMKSLYKNFDREYFRSCIDKFRLPCDKKIKEFSTGMKAKLKLAVATSYNARLLILDEPTSGLDVVARDEIIDMLREFMEKDEERTIIISSHISSDLENLCDDLYFIDSGKVIFHEDTDVLLSDYALLKVFDEDYENLDKEYILKAKKESYGYRILTNQKQYYMDNYPKIAIEKSSIDDVIMMMLKEEK